MYQERHICVHTNNQKGLFLKDKLSSECIYYIITISAVKLYECIDVGILRKESLVIRQTSYIEKFMACSKSQTGHISVSG